MRSYFRENFALAYVTGLVNQELLAQNEYSAAENRILRAHLPARLRLSDPERSTLAEIGKLLGARPSPSGLRGQAGHDFGLVPETDCPEVRWLETPPLPRQTANRTEAGGAGRADGQREFRLRVRPDRGRSG